MTERDIADFTGHRYAIGVNSCGSALFLSLWCAGVQHGDVVLTNAFTFSAVPSAIVHAGARCAYLESLPNYILDIDDLQKKVDETGARHLVVSHMRGRMSDMDTIASLCADRGVTLIEDCAHALGIRWGEEHVGHHGLIAALSTQSSKMLNSGEGGFLLTNDDEIAARAILAAGSYERLYRKHLLRPPEELFEKLLWEVPNFSLRMSELTASVLRPQIPLISTRVASYQRRYQRLSERLSKLPFLEIPQQLPEVSAVGDSLQFNLVGLDPAHMTLFLSKAAQRGLPLRLFGATDNARNFHNWHYAPATRALPRTDRMLAYAIDLRLPLTLDDREIDTIYSIIRLSIAEMSFAFSGTDPAAHTLAHLRFADVVTDAVARLATDWAGSPFVGRVLHPLDDIWSFMKSLLLLHFVPTGRAKSHLGQDGGQPERHRVSFVRALSNPRANAASPSKSLRVPGA